MKKVLISNWRIFLVPGSIIITFVAVSFVVLSSSYDNATAKAFSQTQTTSNLVAEWIAESFSLPKMIVQDAANSVEPEQLQYPPIDARLQTEQTDLLKRKHHSNDMILFFGLFDKDCTVTHTSIDINLGQNFAQREYCTLAKETPINTHKISNVFTSSTSKINITVSYPVLRDETFYGFSLVGLDLSFFQRWLGRMNRHEELIVSIFDAKQTLMARVPFTPDKIGKAINNPVLGAFIPSSAMKKSFRLESPIDGIDRVWSFHRVKNAPFVVVSGISPVFYLKNWRVEFFTTVLVNILLTAIMVFATRKYVQNIKLTAKMETLAYTDRLTEVASRLYLEKYLQEIHALFKRFGKPYSLILLDIDHFKRVNDDFGHQVGDQVLAKFATILQDSTREADLVGRWGGEEFLIICPETDKAGASQLADNIRRKVEGYSFPSAGYKTASFGVAEVMDGEDIDSLSQRVDKALYRAKESGRNRVEVG